MLSWVSFILAFYFVSFFSYANVDDGQAVKYSFVGGFKFFCVFFG